MKRINIVENNLQMIVEITDTKEVRLLHFSCEPFCEESIQGEYEKSGFRIAELALAGFDRPEERHGIKYTVTAPGYRMKYLLHTDIRNKHGRKLEITTVDKPTGVKLISHYQFFDGISVVQAWSEVINEGNREQGIEYVSSFNLNGIENEGLLPRDERMKISLVHNSWHRELQWKEYTLPELGLECCQRDANIRSSKAFSVTNKGNWSTKEFLPMGCVSNQETGAQTFWQIEHNGSWHWEISDQTNHLYLQLSGPTENEAHWYKRLQPGDSFLSIPVAVGSVYGGLDEMMEHLTTYRRKIRRPNADNEKLGVIFNDYMNCLWADPTTEKEIPLIDKAAEVGCEYYCIDAGWYANGYWWDGVGEWQESTERFPGGIKEVLSYIKGKGMVPGLWLELEVMGIKCRLASELPDECFFQRHGKRVYDRSRYQLDFRHPEVISHATSVIDRLVNDYGVGYIKMDYNIEPGIGTEVNADSFGDGLLQHERAYLNWLDQIFDKYPQLIIENCSSGGLRMDYAMLKRHSIQSTSDQEDYRHYATIAANAPIGVTMEQAAVWSYPKLEGDKEETIFNMVNAMLLRIHQSGHMVDISSEKRSLVKDGIDYYKQIRDDIKKAVPFWPLGVSAFSDNWISLGLNAGNKNYIAVWRRGGTESKEILLKHLKGLDLDVKCAYPKSEDCRYRWNKQRGSLTVLFHSEISARIFELKRQDM